MKRLDFYQLYDEACKARDMAYAPYSGFTVGAALLTTDEKVYLGCNIENSAYTPTCCAERVAFYKAVSDGYTKPSDFQAIAIAGGMKDEEARSKCPPCGVCRQVMSEFCDADSFLVIMTGDENGPEVHNLSELLPFGFKL